MLRSVRWILGSSAVLVALGATVAEAQYYGGGGLGGGGFGGGYGGFGGWGGVGSSVGLAEQGYGAAAAGQGVLDEDSAIANSVNTDTVMRYNQYLYNSKIEAQKRYNAYQTRRLNLDKAHYDARQARIRDNPSDEDINNGDALNVLLDQMTDPKLHRGPGLRLANDSLSPEAIKDIPFRDETDAITLSLDELTDPEDWPLPLRSDLFKPEREGYQKAVDDALAEDKDGGSLKPETIAKVRDAVARIYRKVGDNIPKTKQPDHNQATQYLKGLAGLSKMLEKPNVEKLLSDLEKVKTTSVGNLIGFMHAYNLRFAPATTPKQRAVYNSLYPLMTASRDKLVGQGQAADNANQPVAANSNPPPDAPKPADHPTAIFHGFKDTHLNSGTNPNP